MHNAAVESRRVRVRTCRGADAALMTARCTTRRDQLNQHALQHPAYSCLWQHKRQEGLGLGPRAAAHQARVECADIARSQRGRMQHAAMHVEGTASTTGNLHIRRLPGKML